MNTDTATNRLDSLCLAAFLVGHAVLWDGASAPTSGPWPDGARADDAPIPFALVDAPAGAPDKCAAMRVEIKAMRKAAGLTQKMLAARMGVGRSGLATVENGSTVCSAEYVDRVRAACATVDA